MFSIKQNIIALLTATVWLASSTCLASHDLTAGELYDDCKELMREMEANTPDEKYTLNSGICMGFIDGFDDMHVNMAYLLSGGSEKISDMRRNMIYCVPDGVTNKELVQNIFEYLDKHPDAKTKPAGSILLILLEEKYPCSMTQPELMINTDEAGKQAYYDTLKNAFSS